MRSSHGDVQAYHGQQDVPGVEAIIYLRLMILLFPFNFLAPFTLHITIQRRNFTLPSHRQSLLRFIASLLRWRGEGRSASSDGNQFIQRNKVHFSELLKKKPPYTCWLNALCGSPNSRHWVSSCTILPPGCWIQSGGRRAFHPAMNSLRSPAPTSKKLEIFRECFYCLIQQEKGWRPEAVKIWLLYHYLLPRQLCRRRRKSVKQQSSFSRSYPQSDAVI